MYPTLKALRLSTPRFAFLNLIQRTLFSDILFVPVVGNVEDLARPEFFRIAPFVTRVSFVVPIKHWILTLCNIKSLKAPPFGESQELPEICHFNHSRQRALGDLLQTALIKVAWSSALKSLYRVNSVRFKTLGFECVCKGAAHWYMYKNQMVPQAYQDASREIAAPLGDALFATGIFCLAMARVKLRKLKVECVLTDKFGWANLPAWHKLNLSQLEYFRFAPLVRPWASCPFTCIEDAFDPVVAAPAAVAAVLQKCRTRLWKFAYKGRCPMPWPDEEVIKLPNLVWLSIRSGSIYPEDLRAWMKEMPSLRILQLNNVSLCEFRDLRVWREVFDAIRDHPNALYVDLKKITRVPLVHDTSDGQELLDLIYSDQITDREAALPMYLNGLVEWDEDLAELLWGRDSSASSSIASS